MERKFTILDTTMDAREVATQYDLPLHKKGDPENEKVIVAVSKREEVKTVEWAISIRDVVGVITWNLDEKDVLVFCEFDVPVFVGIVPMDQIEASVLKKGTQNINDLEKDRTQRLAVIEELLEMNEWE